MIGPPAASALDMNEGDLEERVADCMLRQAMNMASRRKGSWYTTTAVYWNYSYPSGWGWQDKLDLLRPAAANRL